MSTTPAELLAEIPSTLGFYPHESVVFLAFTGTDPCYDLGPTIRIDLDDPTALAQALAWLKRFESDLIFAVVVTDDNDLNVVGPAVSTILEAEIDALHLIWQVAAIEQGETFAALWQKDEQVPSDFLEGRVAPVHEAIGTRESLSRGHLIAETREDITDSFALDPSRGRDSAQLLAEAADLEHLSTDRQECTHLIYDLRAALLVRNIDAIEVYLVACFASSASPMCRDLAMGELLDSCALSKEVLTDLARTVDDDCVRANCLSVLAICLMRDQDFARASLAVQAASAADPHHSLTMLLVQALQCGALKVVGDSIAGAIREARNEVELTI